jgi:molybdenum cofactor cytidylyltransferase
LPRTLLLAAGASLRFGSNKLLASMPDGTPVLLQSAQTLLEACGTLLAVLRPEDDTAARLLSDLPGLEITVCPEAHLGMGRSLAWGVTHSPDADGWLVALADMPYVRRESICAVLDTLRNGASIAAPVFGDRRGHPVGFSRIWRDDLTALAGDRGGQSILLTNPEAITLVRCEDPGVLRDIDRPDDADPLPNESG